MVRQLLCYAVLGAIVAPLHAEDGAVDAVRDPASILTRFVNSELHCSARISVARSGGLGGAIMMGGGATTPFKGRCEIWRTPAQAFVVATAQELDGFALLRKDGITYVRSTHIAGEGKSVSQLGDELPELLNATRVRQWAAKAKWETADEPAEGGAVWKTQIKPGRAGLRAGGGMRMTGMTGRILHVEVKVTVDKSSQVQALEFAVIRNSPMAGLRNGGGVQIQGMPAGMKMPQEDEEDSRTIYALKVKKTKPGKRLRAARDYFAKLLAEEEDE